MSTALLVAFLAGHGLVHLVVWLPRPDPDAEHSPPFEPDHSALLTVATVPRSAVHRVAVALAVAAATAYIVVAVAVAVGAPWVAGLALLAAGLGLGLKVLFFHPWLSLGVLLDVGVLTAALLEWPIAL
jgi:hypothetical protein